MGTLVAGRHGVADDDWLKTGLQGIAGGALHTYVRLDSAYHHMGDVTSSQHQFERCVGKGRISVLHQDEVSIVSVEFVEVGSPRTFGRNRTFGAHLGREPLEPANPCLVIRPCGVFHSHQDDGYTAAMCLLTKVSDRFSHRLHCGQVVPSAAEGTVGMAEVILVINDYQRA